MANANTHCTDEGEKPIFYLDLQKQQRHSLGHTHTDLYTITHTPYTQSHTPSHIPNFKATQTKAITGNNLACHSHSFQYLMPSHILPQYIIGLIMSIQT